MAEESQTRPDRPTAAPVVHFRIDEQVERLKKVPAWRSGSRNAITLTKEPALRVVLTVRARAVSHACARFRKS